MDEVDRMKAYKLDVVGGNYTFAEFIIPEAVEMPPLASLLAALGAIQISRNFTAEEIACRHCGKAILEDYRLMEVAQGVRNHFGVPIRLVGYRCEEHNTAIGGDPNSAHMIGLALDISAWNHDVSPEAIKQFIVDNYSFVEGIGIYDGHVHIDTFHGGKRVYWDKRTK